MTAAETASLLNRMLAAGQIDENTPIVFGSASKHEEITTVIARDINLRDDNGKTKHIIRKVLLS